jgi:hypothetical protein
MSDDDEIIVVLEESSKEEEIIWITIDPIPFTDDNWIVNKKLNI